VRLNVTAEQVSAVHAELGPTVLVEEMARPGVELIVGARRTPFGPVVMAGAGGVLAELVRDTRLRLAPVDRAQALALLSETRIWRVLQGFRGQPRCDVEAAADAIVAVSHLICDLAVDEVDINPLLVYENGVLVVDALVRA